MFENKNRAVGCDVGTMFFQVAEIEQGNINVRTTRNAFVELEETDDMGDILKQNNWQYVRDGNKYYVLGEDAMRVARMLPGRVELRRPLQDGVLNRGEDKKMLVLAELISSSVGQAIDDKSVICTCISSKSVDGSLNSTFHRARLEGMFSRNGWKTKIIEEGYAVIVSEKPIVINKKGEKIPYSGIGISWGAGRTNCVLAYRGVQILGMSVARAGDWIDTQVSLQTDTPLSQITAKKEKQLDFNNIDYDDDVVFALDAYYGEMIKFVFDKFLKKFMEVRSEFDAPLDIIVAGGTSMPEGFCNKVKDVVEKMSLPFEVKAIKKASDPRNAVVKGCLSQALVLQKQLLNK